MRVVQQRRAELENVTGDIIRCGSFRRAHSENVGEPPYSHVRVWGVPPDAWPLARRFLDITGASYQREGYAPSHFTEAMIPAAAWRYYQEAEKADEAKKNTAPKEGGGSDK